MTKFSLPFCSAQDGESTDMNCLVFWPLCKNGKIWTKHQVYNKGILPILGTFSLCEILISSESTFHSEWNGVINFVTSCSVVELLAHKNPASYSLVPHTYTYRDTNMDTTLSYTLCLYYSTVLLIMWECVDKPFLHPTQPHISTTPPCLLLAGTLILVKTTSV